jgi:hypothetical protein
MKTREHRPDNPPAIPHVEVELVAPDDEHASEGPTRLEWALRPSCLVSIIAVTLIAVLLRTRMPLPFPVMLVMAGAIWFVMVSVLVRWRAPRR